MIFGFCFIFVLFFFILTVLISLIDIFFQPCSNLNIRLKVIEMLFIPEILKIIEGGVKSNSSQVIAYAELLADKMEKEGMDRPAKNIRKKLSSQSASGLSSTSVANMQGAILPVDRDSRLTLGDETYPCIDDISIELPTFVEQSVSEFLSFIDKAHLLADAGVGITPSMLIYGPPGCGKTQLAKYISAHLGLPLITARGDTLISSFLGSTAKNLRSLFDHAAQRPCVLFLDEFDAFAKARDDQHELGELKRVVVSLLQNIDALPEGTILLAATNHEDLLDPAVWRRFAYRVQIPLPDIDTREKLIHGFLGQYCPANIKTLVEITDGMSGALIEQACKAEIRNSIISGKDQISVDSLVLKLVGEMYQDVICSGLSVEEKAIKLRERNKKIFTVNRLSALLGISVGKVSKITSTKG
ncbi:ATP-binding protein [Vibrio parahaemolyticus]|nr:ATP-binding protein [Vibrio parahaemolyticus]EQM39987.1 AAA domain family protein [Vibrio parahaemolyticus NIHCB0757]HCD1292864.1 ATP-binding protein [Vibrio parahaemolyticus]